ncbi:MAG TPA: hypothetical protein DCY89_01325 [Gammaproteobacteria bacterium]|nr:hypothetical protein [Gammaproteobacteria bacterium]
MLILLAFLTIAVGMALAVLGLPRVHVLRQAHRLLAAALICLAFIDGAWLLAGSAALVAGAGLLAAHLPDRDWGLTLLLPHIAGAILVLVIVALGSAVPG